MTPLRFIIELIKDKLDERINAASIRHWQQYVSMGR